MITVLLSTKNRAQRLGETLECFCSLQSPIGGWKLVVVDNGSSDHTEAVLQRFSERLPLVRLKESHGGKNSALNTGLAQVEGDLIVLTDDDVMPRKDWLVRFRAAADEHPDYAIFGGVILPRWEVPPPQWVYWLDMGPLYTVTRECLKEGEIPPDQITVIYGPNMAIRSQVFLTGIRFDETIGPTTGSYPMGSETELLMRLRRKQYRSWHVQDAVVEHVIRREQLNKAWVFKRAVRFGRGQQRLYPVKKWGRTPRHLFRDIPLAALRVVIAGLTFNRREFLKSRWHFCYLVGKALEAHHMEDHVTEELPERGVKKTWPNPS